MLAPDAVAGDIKSRGVFRNVPAALRRGGVAFFSGIPLPRREFWHETMHVWCTVRARQCVLAVLATELRVDLQAEASAAAGVDYRVQATGRSLPPLPHDLWLMVLTYVPRSRLGQ